MKRVGTIAAGVFAAQVFGRAVQGVQDFVGGSVKAFSDLNESVNAVDKIFGRSAGQIHTWAAKNATSLGLSTRAFNELAVPLGALLKNAGLPLQQVTGWTTKLTERAADMASVFNVDVGEALTAIQAGLRGESDPLERFGVSLSAAKVEAAAMAATGKTNAKQLTDQEKATARLNLIMAQTAATAGDFRGTSDGLANSQRIAAAKTEELQAKIGKKLAPIVQKITELKLKLVSVITDKLLPGFDRAWRTMTEAVRSFWDKAKPWLLALWNVIGPVLRGALDNLRKAWDNLQPALKILIPILKILGVLLGVVVVTQILAVTAVLFALSALVRFVIVPAWKLWMAVSKAVAEAIVAAVTGVWNFFTKTLPHMWDNVKNATTAAKNWVVARWNDLVGFVKGLPGRISGAVSHMWDGVKWAFRAALNWIIDKWNSFRIPAIRVAGVQVSPEINFPNLPRFHRGGVVPGPFGRERLILARGGERVLTREQDRARGGDTYNINVRAYSERFSLKQVMDDLALHGVA